MGIKALALDILPPVVTRSILRFKRQKTSPVRPFIKPHAIKWLSYINPGMLRDSNLDLLAYCLPRLPSSSGAVIEIGSWCGLSLNHILMLLKTEKAANPVFSVDEWQMEGAEYGSCLPGTSVTFNDYQTLAINTFRANVSLFNGDRLPHHIRSSSDAFFAAWEKHETKTDLFDREVKLGGPIAFAYIDGSHTYEQSKRDFHNIDKHLMAGGFIVFDDSGDDSEWESRWTAQEAATLPRYELIAKNPNYCIRKVRSHGTPTAVI